MEHRIPQDGRVSLEIGSGVQDIRVSAVPTANGESLVLRLLGRRDGPVNLDSLGMNSRSLSAARKILKLSSGLIIVSGPTGSGKTTTLNTLILEMDRTGKKIITIEDPVEYVVDGVTRVQINEAAGLTFGSVLKKILRQDPDIIMIGEIRDPETASIAVRSALTGHLVLSTLHTDDSVSVINRLTNMGVEPYLAAAVLKVSMAQRLVRRLCPACRKKREPSASEKALFRKYGTVPDFLFDPAGCSECGWTGYRGRVLIHEYFIIDEEIEQLISLGTDHVKIRDILKKRGMHFLIDDGLEKIRQGITTLAEIGEAAALL